MDTESEVNVIEEEEIDGVDDEDEEDFEEADSEEDDEEDVFPLNTAPILLNFASQFAITEIR